MVIGILKEPASDKRVSIVPDIIPDLEKLGFTKILVEPGSGTEAFYPDSLYTDKGAQLSDAESIVREAELIVRINVPSGELLDKMKKEQILLTQFNPIGNLEQVKDLQNRGLCCFSMDLIPRITRAQSMDVLSSMATGAGYKAVLMAAMHLPKFFPMFMTAAGTLPPAKVLILGAGVAGLQAIATARRLGAVVEAFDVRAAVKEEVQSLGAKFVEVEGAQEDKAAGGYAIEQSEEYKQRQAQLIHERGCKSDVIITTAQIPGRTAPILIKADTVRGMKPGSVIVDLAASTGGNCELTEADKIVKKNEVIIIGESNLTNLIPYDGSKMYSKNVLNFLKLLVKEEAINLDWEDQVIHDTCATHSGEIKNERIRKLM